MAGSVDLQMYCKCYWSCHMLWNKVLGVYCATDTKSTASTVDFFIVIFSGMYIGCGIGCWMYTVQMTPDSQVL